MITTDAALAEFLPRLKAAPWVALDTEADSLHSYPEKLCLVQLSISERDVLVDPLAGINLRPLWEALRDRELLLHGGDYDLRLLYRSQDFTPAAVFDTMLAARLLGLKEFGLNSLVRRFLGVELEKGPQRADWSRRPLTQRMITYARNDSHYLHPLSEVMRPQLAARGRLDWHAQMCCQLIRDACRPPDANGKDDWRIKHSDQLSPRGQAILRELWHWREREARAANRPPFFVLSHDRLFQLAAALAQDQPYLDLIPPRYSPRRRARLISALQHALNLPESSWPKPRPRVLLRLTPAQKKLLERLHERRNRAAAQLGLDPTLIASRSTLTRLAVNWEQHATELLPWQRALLQP